MTELLQSSPFQDEKGWLKSEEESMDSGVNAELVEKSINNIVSEELEYVVSGPEPQKEYELDTNKFVFGPAKRMKDEEFQDYKIRRKTEKIQLKLLDKYGRSQWPGSKGTYRKEPLRPKL